eukprot:5034-Heterococcus_DN1.PRE.2
MTTSSSSTQEHLKRAKSSACAILHPLDTQLGLIFEMLGCGHWIYAGTVSHRWRDLYREVCAAVNAAKKKWKRDDEHPFKRVPVPAHQHAPTVTLYKSLFESQSRLQWACQCDLQLKINAFLPQFAGRYADKEMLYWAKQRGLPWYAAITHGAAIEGRCDMLVWLHEEQGVPIDVVTIFRAALTNCDIATLDWLCKGEGSPRLRQDFCARDEEDSTTWWYNASFTKNVSVIAWLKLHGFLPPFSVAGALCKTAAERGHTSSVKYLRQLFPDETASVSYSAVKSGNLELVQHLLSSGCAPDTLRFSMPLAVCSGSIEMIEYLRTKDIEGDYPWDQAAMTSYLITACKMGHVDVVKWFREQGAEWPDQLWTADTCPIVTYCWPLPTLQYAIESNCSWGNWQSHVCVDLVANLYTAEVEWAHANGCPCGDDCPMRR